MRKCDPDKKKPVVMYSMMLMLSLEEIDPTQIIRSYFFVLALFAAYHFVHGCPRLHITVS